MTDKELLELAAKAAGIEICGPATKFIASGVTDLDLVIRNDRGGDSVWNPLTYDGDALRLAVKLNLSLSTGPCIVKCNSISGALRGNFIEEDSIYQDHYAATRRAIVRAAAEIGKNEN